MRFLLSLSTFVVTMVLALIGFAYTAINFPTTMRDLQAGAQQISDQVKHLALPDTYMVWVDIFLQPNQIVLVAFSIVMRILIGILLSIFDRKRASSEPSAPVATTAAPSVSKSPFGNWT
jgi:hypothetical protein